MAGAPPRQRLSAEERRHQVVDAALRRFAVGGMAGTSTEDIAADVELSQPYLFRLFRTKRDLFLACCEESFRRTGAAFRGALRDAADDADVQARLEALGQAYEGLLADSGQLRFQLQMYTAAAGDAIIREHVRAGFKALVETLRELSGADEERLRAFVAKGMLLDVVASLGLHEIASEDEWAAAWCSPAMLAP